MNKTVKLFMTASPICVRNNDTYVQVLDKMKHHEISHIPVINNGDKLVGIISNNDLLKRSKKLLTETTGTTYSNLHLSSLEAENFMTSDVITVKSSDSIDLAIEILLQKKFHCVPVVNHNDKVVGILSSLDILKSYYQEYG